MSTWDLPTFDHLPPLPAHCHPENSFLSAYSAIWSTCVPTDLAFLSSLLGTLSIISWLFAQLPQIHRNHALKSTSGLSIYFLVEWCLGDLCNLLGATLSGQAPWQIIIAGYYCFVDAVLVGQYLWYDHLEHGQQVRHFPVHKWHKDIRLPRAPLILAGLMATTAHAASLRPTPMYNAGTVFAWLSTSLYLLSRLPQLWKNYQRKSTAGLSPQLFAAAFCGNLFYASSILANPRAWDDYGPYGGRGWVGPDGSNRQDWILRALPFWLGAAGVLALDGAVGLQFVLYGPKHMVVVVKDTDSIGSSMDVAEDVSWRRVSGWMRGWQPSFKEVRPKTPERQGLLSSIGRRFSGLSRSSAQSAGFYGALERDS